MEATIDETTSAAIMAALGPQLEWFRPERGGPYHASALVDSDLYGCHPQSGTELFCLGYVASTAEKMVDITVKKDFLSLAAAKAACEYHHAHGKWPDT